MSSYDPAEGAQFVLAYNALLTGFHDRGYMSTYVSKKTGDGVSQSDLKVMRNQLQSMCGSFVRFAELSAHFADDDPQLFSKFPIKIHDDKGFLALPARYNSGAVNLFTIEDGVNLDTLPILAEHLQDICDILNTMTHKLVSAGDVWEELSRVTYLGDYDDVQIIPNMLTQPRRISLKAMYMDAAFSTNIDGSRTIGTAHYCKIRCTDNTRLVNPTTITSYLFKSHYIANKMQTDSHWTTMNSGPDCIFVQEGQMITPFPDASYFEEFYFEAKNSIRRYTTSVSLPAIDTMLDSSENDIAKVGCGCVTKSIREEFSHDGMTADIPLAISNGSEGLRAYAYYTLYEFAGVSGLHYSLDVSLSPQVANGSILKDNTRIYWRFSQMRRPRGASVLLYWKFVAAGVPDNAYPVNGGGYCLNARKNTAGAILEYDVAFADKVHHVFSTQGTFVKAWQQHEDEILYLSNTFPGLSANATLSDNFLNEFVCFMGRSFLEYTPAVYGSYGQNLLTPPRINRMLQYLPNGSLWQTVLFLYSAPGGSNQTFFTVEVYDKDGLLISRKGNSRATEAPGGELFNTYHRGGEGTTVYSTLRSYFPIGNLEERHTTLEGTEFVEKRTYANFPWGREVVCVQTGEDAATGNTTWYEYYDSCTPPEAYRQLRSATQPDGSWVLYHYDSEGRIWRVITPLGNYALPPATPDWTQCQVTEYGYLPNADTETTYSGDQRVRTEIMRVAQVEVSRRYSLYYANELHTVECRSAGAAWNAVENLVTKRHSYPAGDFAGRHWKTEYPDGRMEFTLYENLSGGGRSVTTTQGVPNAAKDAIVDGLRSVTTLNANQETVRVQSWDIASGLKVEDEQYTLDHLGRRVRTDYADGSFSTTEFTCCGPGVTVGRDGTRTTYTYTPDQKPWQTTTAGILTESRYHANGQLAETRVIASDGSCRLTVNEYDTVGRLIRTKVALATLPATAEAPTADEAYAITSYIEARVNDHWRKTTTYPDGGIQMETFQRDGTLYSTSGNSVAAPMLYSTLLVGNEVCHRTQLVRPDGVTESSDTLTNFCGQQYKTVNPDGTIVRTEYDAYNRPQKHTAANGVITLTEYNAKGEVSRTGIDLDRDGILAGADPISEYANVVTTRTDGALTTTVRRTTTREYTATTPETTQVVETAVDGSRNWQTVFGRTQSFSRSYINDGEELGMTEMTVRPDGVTVVNSYSNGLLESSTHSVLGVTHYDYDVFNRVASVTHAENAVDHVISYEYDARNLVIRQTETAGAASREITYTYDKQGRKLTETKPGARTVATEYYPTGELKKITGAETYPVEYTYEVGRLKTLTTYRDYPNQPDVTTWIYNSFGQLSSKQYANASQIHYNYNALGQLASRKWARSRITSYTYDNAGRPAQVSYDGTDTPAIAYSYDRRGRLIQVTDAAGVHALTYNADNTPATESIPYLTAATLAREYDALGRPATMTFGSGYTVTFSYDAMSRLATAAAFGHVATYTRVPGSNRPNTTVFNNGTADIHTATRSYDNFNRLTGINGYGYTLNAKDQRTELILPDASKWLYTYDELGQVITGSKDTPQTNYAYAYDTIGNRESATTNNTTTLYTANELNQYTAIGATTPTYDADGNLLTGYDDWTLEWNGENRLKSMFNATAKLEFAYDYMGRRFSKKVYTKSGATWSLSNEKKFVYDGYKQIAEYAGATATMLTVWQPESSGDFDVPLWSETGTEVQTYIVDGNKNVRQLKNAAGTVIANYDYDPFGNVTATGSVTPWQFSSEYRDAETGLIYYNYRYYAPTIGRWLNCDENTKNKGSLNLYAFCENNDLSNFDFLGHEVMAIDSTNPNHSSLQLSEIWPENGIKEATQNALALFGTYAMWNRRCKDLNNEYHALKCKGCKGLCYTAQEATKRAACLSHELALRFSYLAYGCDFILEGSKQKGIDLAISKHIDQYNKKLTAFYRCIQKTTYLPW